MPRAFRNSMNSGVLDPKLAARADLDQWRSGLQTGNNVVLLPQGGVKRRPGTDYLRAVAEPGHMARFRFSVDLQYLLHFRNLFVDVCSSAGGKITQVATPYATADLPTLHTMAQTADTMVVFHSYHAPRRVLRGTLRSPNPVQTFAASPIVRIHHPAHGLLTGDKVGLSGLTDVANLDGDADFNTSHTVETVGAALSAAPLTVTSANITVVCSIPSSYGLAVGDSITLSGLTSVAGIPIQQLNRTQEITAVGSGTVSFAVETTAATNATGGGSAGAWVARSFYQIDLGGNVNSGPLGAAPARVDGTTATKVWVQLGASYGLATGDYVKFAGLTTFGGIVANQLNATHVITGVSGTEVSVTVATGGTLSATGGGSSGSFIAWLVEEAVATSSASGGGTAGLAWMMHSLAPNDDREVAFENLPQFDFQDKDSPPPKNEIQELVFTDFLPGDEYILLVSVPTFTPRSSPSRTSGSFGNRQGSTVIRTDKLRWNATLGNNATIMEQAVNDYLGNTNDLVSVTDETDGGNPTYHVTFTDPVPVAAIQVQKIVSTSGIITVTELVEGGSRTEDVISDTRGWPSGGLFYQRRLWMYGIASRPATLLASKTEQVYDFDIGSALDSDAIEATGDFDPIRHLVAERGLYLLTSGGEVSCQGGADDAAITPSNINLKVSSRYGSTSVVPATIGGWPVYVDRIGRNIRQISAADSLANIESKEISLLSQHLINDPLALEVWRNDDGDYLAVLNTDGTIAVLNMNTDQGVAGWTQWTTTGTFRRVCEVDDNLFVIVARAVGEGTVFYLERFDYGYFTDCAFQIANVGATTVTNLFHLEGLTVQVRCNEATMDPQEVDGGAVSILSGPLPVTVTSSSEAGLAIPTPTIEPTPPQLAEYSSISKVTLDLYQSRSVLINGYAVRPYLLGAVVQLAVAPPLITGMRAMQVLGWSQRPTVTITMPEPQPCTLRAIEMEVA